MANNRTVHTSRCPEIDELIALKDFLVNLVLGKEDQTKQKILQFLKTFLLVLKSCLMLMIPFVLFGLMLWGLFDAFRNFLNPLGIENYF